MSLGLGSDLGKRKNRWEEEGGGGAMSAGAGCEYVAVLIIVAAYFKLLTD